MNSKFKPASPLSATATASTQQAVQRFTPVSPKQLADIGASNPQVINLLATFDSPTGILEYGKDVMASISAKSDKLLN
jgi:uncharacterized protein YaaN involved in tellurite resistance